MIVALALILVAVGTVVFHFMSPWWWTPIASNWGYIDDTIVLTFWITGVVFIAVILFMAYCCIRFRYRKEARAEYRPENSKLEWWLTILTTVGVVAMLTPGLFVWNQFVTVPPGAAEVEALGQQWSWSYRLPGKDGVLGTTDPRNVSDDNPYGINPKDPNGQDDILVDGDELHLPLGRPVNVLLRSLDVLHDFYVPEFRAKMDMVPGLVTFFWMTPTRNRNLRYPVRRTVWRRATMGCAARSWLKKRAAFEVWLNGTARRLRNCLAENENKAARIVRKTGGE